MDVNQLMVNVNSWVKDILKENYVGVYFHGSLRLGSFNPNIQIKKCIQIVIKMYTFFLFVCYYKYIGETQCKN